MNRGSYVSFPPPFSVYRFVWNAWRGVVFVMYLSMSAWSTVPSFASRSPHRIETVLPAGPEIFSRGKPAKFCPKSTTNTPGFGSVTRTGLRVFTTRIGGIAWAVICAFGTGASIAGAHDRSS